MIEAEAAVIMMVVVVAMVRDYEVRGFGGGGEGGEIKSVGGGVRGLYDVCGRYGGINNGWKQSTGRERERGGRGRGEREERERKRGKIE